MPTYAKVTATLSALIHVFFFYMESINWLDPGIYEVFQVESLADAQVLDVYVKNQGYYNLFLAFGMFSGLALVGKNRVVGTTLIGYVSAVMVGAALVLAFTLPAMVTGVVLQGVPAVITLVGLVLANRADTGTLAT